MDEYFVISVVDYDVWFSGSHNSCCMWLEKWIKPESHNKFYIVPKSMCEKIGIATIFDTLEEIEHSNFA